jgi:hypothetical protein
MAWSCSTTLPTTIGMRECGFPLVTWGLVAVLDAVTDKITTVGGFHTGEVKLLGRKRVMGPSSVTWTPSFPRIS